MYVALTRSRSLGLINIASEDKEEKEIKRYNSKFIKMKIDGYNEQDAKKGLTNDLTVENIQELVDRETNICYYCRKTLYNGNFTLDRIDSLLSHNLNNVVLCCKSCNCAKSDMVLDQNNVG
jgi:hypothetical protein